MDLNRRSFIKGALYATGGALLGSSALARAGLGLAGADSVPVHILTTHRDIAASFASGVRAALPSATDVTEQCRAGMDLLAHTTRALQQQHPVRLVGMVDDATGELLTATARRFGARISWLVQHAADHQQIRHQAIHTLAVSLESSSDDWATQLGYALIQPQANPSIHQPRSQRLQGRFVSFVIEV